MSVGHVQALLVTIACMLVPSLSSSLMAWIGLLWLISRLWWTGVRHAHFEEVIWFPTPAALLPF